MFLLQILAVFLLLPALLVLLAVALPPAGRFVTLFLIFPLGLIAFVLWRHAATGGAHAHRAAPPGPARPPSGEAP